LTLRVEKLWQEFTQPEIKTILKNGIIAGVYGVVKFFFKNLAMFEHVFPVLCTGKKGASYG
jgi:hypothetical protein